MNFQLQIKSETVDYEIDVEGGRSSEDEDVRMEMVDVSNFFDCKLKVIKSSMDTLKVPKKEEGLTRTWARATTNTQTRLEPEPILCRKRSYSSKNIFVQREQKMYKCIGCTEISTDLKTHIEEKHIDVGEEVIVHAMKDQCDWCGLNNSDLKYVNFAFSDLKYVKSCRQSLNLAIDVKKTSSEVCNDEFGEHFLCLLFLQFFGQFLMIFQNFEASLGVFHMEKYSKITST